MPDDIEKTPEELEAEALAVIDAGIKEASQENGVEPPKPETGNDPGTGGDGGAPGGDGKPAAGDPAKPADGSAAPAPGADGKPPEAKPGEQPGAKPGEAKPGEQPGAKPGEAGKPPELTDEEKRDPDLAKATKPLAANEGSAATKERFHTLSELAKTRTQERDKANEQVDTLFMALEDAGIKPEALPELLVVQKGINGRDMTLKRKAFEWAQGIVTTLAEALGEPKPGGDPLEGFDDLKREVQEGAITKARAAELATARRREKVDKQYREQEDQTRVQQIAVETAKKQLNDLGAELYRANKDEFTAKRTALTEAVSAIKANSPPEQWVARVRAAYKNIKVTVPPSRPGVGDGAPAGTGAGNSIRPKQPAGGSESAPNSHLDAIERGIAAAAGR